MKKICLGMTLTILLIFSSVTTIFAETSVVHSQSNICGENISWYFDDTCGEFVLEGYGAMTDFRGSVIPWAQFREKIKKVTISEGITSLCAYAFLKCTNLTSINSDTYGEAILPDSIHQLGESVFEECISLQTVKLSNALVEIPKAAFKRCTSLIEITLPPTIKKIDRSAISQCENLEQIEIPDGVEELWGLQGCDSLKTVTIPGSVRILGTSTLSSCKKLQTVILGEGITKITTGMCILSKVKNVYIPKSVQVIEMGAFYMSSIENVYYEGSEEDWKNVKIENYVNVAQKNNSLSECNFYFLSQPEDIGNIMIPGDNGDTIIPNESNTQTDRHNIIPLQICITILLAIGAMIEIAILLKKHITHNRLDQYEK